MYTFELVSLNGIKFGDEVYEIILPTPDGYIAILPNHMPLVSLVEPGVISIRRSREDSDERMEHYAINGGIVEVTKKFIRVLVDEADHSSELLAEEVAEALARAKELEKSARDELSLEQARQRVQVAQARLKIAELKKRRRVRP